eukprot:Skav234017  [mRNA]  locus=scaffold3484:148954:150630:- [translate_table: standard]
MELLNDQLLENGPERTESQESGEETEIGFLFQHRWLKGLLGDLAASVVFWWTVNWALQLLTSDAMFYAFLTFLVLAMTIWRVIRVCREDKTSLNRDLPYTCVHVKANDRDLFLVATVHVSPRAPRDVETVIHSTKPSVIMIELDEERLDRMRQVPAEPPESTLQPVTFTSDSSSDSFEITTHAQRAIWNVETAGEHFCGEVFYRPEDEYGLEAGDAGRIQRDSMSTNFLLVRRGSANSEWAPFALKAHNAAKLGASALLVANSEETLPMGRLVDTICSELRVAFTTGNCNPPVPVLLLKQNDGEKLLQLCRDGRRVTADFTVKTDSYPRRSLPKKLCQGCALILSGIGVLYGVIQCFAVKVGGEFLAAEVAARELDIRCVCIDVDLNRFWSRLAWALLPSPCNLLNAFLSWLAFPRVFLQFLFPAFGNVDTVGANILHGASFSLKTWIAFISAGWCASFITRWTLGLLGSGMEAGAKQAGVMQQTDTDEDDETQAYIQLAVQLYILPQVYLAVVASRDEAMYRSMVRTCRQFAAKSLVVVVGAGHSNGILQHVRQSGL